MAMAQLVRRRLGPVVAPTIGACLVAYFAYHAVQGDHGLIARSNLAVQIDEARETLAGLEQEREYMEHRASLIDPQHVDLDMLDERARVMLNYAGPDDVVLFYPQHPAPVPAE
jgi:cell division protein FtsB